jgi:hypothetical protein
MLSWLVACRLAPLISIASNLIANNININTNKTTTIVGSNLQANANNADFGVLGGVKVDVGGS